MNWLLATAKADERIKAVSSLGQQRYLSVMKESTAVVGNSSSGLIEAPWLGIPTVNIGTRQAGRLRDASVFDCLPLTEDIARIMHQLMTQTQTLSVATQQMSAPSTQILAFLRSVDWGRMLHKRFVDIV